MTEDEKKIYSLPKTDMTKCWEKTTETVKLD